MAEDKDIQAKLKKKRTRELLAYFKQMVGKEGIGATLARTGNYLRRRYLKRSGRFLPKKAVLQAQRQADIAGWPKISILVPVFDPDEKMFTELVESVVGQSYPNWQLCISNAGNHKETANAVLARFAADKRIVSVSVDNGGISANTNSAAQLANGQYYALLDHDDVLAPNAMFEMAKAIHETGAGFLYSDEALFSSSIRRPTVGHFKPDYSPYYLLNCNYIAHLAVIKKEIFDEVGGFRPECDGSQDHDLFLRVLEKTGGAVHIPKVLYYWRQHAASTSTGVEAKPYVQQAAQKAIESHLQRTGVLGTVRQGRFPSTYKMDYQVKDNPLVSIVIPSHEHAEDLATCVHSIYAHTAWPNFEVVVVENGSTQQATLDLYKELAQKYSTLRVEECVLPNGFNFSYLCNFGRAKAKGSLILLLNNDTEVIEANWLEEMVSLCTQADVGAVGAMLYYPDDTVQHAGVITGLGGYAGHSHKYARRDASGYMFRLACVQDVSVVTGACLMVKATAYDAVNGLDEAFSVAFNDVDFCLRLRKAGYRIVFTPYAELYHHESKSRGSDEKGEAARRFAGEQALLKERYGAQLLQDPFYNPNLTKDREDFSESDILPEV
ncbi:MAG: glycosyltransferase family 2 protein [Oscillospiraceae bacterium]